jgi:hypothetical protein
MKNGETIRVDKEDYLKYGGMSWHMARGYAVHTVTKQDSEYWGLPIKSSVSLHRAIMGLLHADKSRMVDHINHDRLDNRRQNLRECTASENARNMKETGNRSAGYKGVHRKTGNRRKPWEARITIRPGKTVSLGHYATAEEAARAYNEAAEKYFGEFACLNVLEDDQEAIA